MQNYLQKSFLNLRLATRTFLALLALSSALLLSALVFRHGFIQRKQADVQSVSSSLFVTLGQNGEDRSANGKSGDAEMNNLTDENAKNEEIRPLYENFGQNFEKVRVLFGDGRVEEIPLEEYTACCVFGEMPVGFEASALMAQAVAVRTFTVRQSTLGKSKHKNADVCTNSACCQSYVSFEDKKVSDENRKKLLDAVNATKGIIMTYEGMPIEAVYHASSGEYTLNSEDVWGGRVEYLRSVPSPEGEAQLTSVLYGHRVGMSQHGANLLAKEGKSFSEILKYYYNGISFDFLA